MDRQTDRGIHGQTDRQTQTYTDAESDRQACMQIVGRQTYREGLEQGTFVAMTSAQEDI